MQRDLLNISFLKAFVGKKKSFFNFDRWIVNSFAVLSDCSGRSWLLFLSFSFRPDRLLWPPPSCSPFLCSTFPSPCPSCHGQNHLSGLPKQASHPMIGDSFRSEMSVTCAVSNSPAGLLLHTPRYVGKCLRALQTLYFILWAAGRGAHLSRASLALRPHAESHQFSSTPDRLCGCQNGDWHLRSSGRSGNGSYRCARMHGE